MLGRPICAMGFEPDLVSGRLCDLPGCASSANPSVSFARSSPVMFTSDVVEVAG
jgi:hypothetical protein